MRLKRLEIQGFKSFARPVCLEFGPGITAIVGPNGSGKSNISDALRWVMGEQSARTLRGQKMEDIIFAGSADKRPLGMAEVQLTLDNSEGFLPVDYAEVTITRRVFRSGESEFMINKQNCRLRDIHDLFTDTGLGREGYAVIGQGQIDTVLSVRSEDRRVLLEETAGIVKYRQRKEQALRKLDETATDLLRVTDILHELESQLGPLERQAKQARLYLELAGQLEHAELDFYHLSWQSLEQKWNQKDANYKELQVEYDQYHKQLGSLEQKKAELQDQSQLLEAEVEHKREELTRLSEAYNEGLHTISLHEERLKNQGTRSTQLTGIMRAKEEELERLGVEDDKLKAEFQELISQIEGQEAILAKAQKDVEDLQTEQLQSQSEINTLKDTFFDFMRDLAESRNFQRNFGERRDNLKAQIVSNQAERKTFQERILQAEEDLKGAQQAETQQREHLEKLTASEQSQQRELAIAKERLGQIQRKRNQLEGQLAQVTTRLKTLQELEEGYEGYALGIRRVMQDAKMAALVLGTVSDVITVPQGLETAFEVALGAGLQNLITTNEADAKSLIDWLKKVKGGRVTILPLSSVRGSEFSSQAKTLLNTPGVLGPALDLLHFDAMYRPALASLLGRVAILENLDVALELKRRLHQFSRLVTKDGSVVFPSGAMTGGSLNSRTSGLLARKSEVGDLDAKLNELGDQLKEQKALEDSLQQSIAKLEEELLALQASQLEAKLAIQRAHQNVEQKQTDRANLLRDQAELETRTADLQALLENLAAESEVAATKVSELELEETQRRERIQQAEARLHELTAAVEQMTQGQTQERVRLAELKGVLENQRIRLANAEQRHKDALRTRNEAELELKGLEADKRQNEQIIAETIQANEMRKDERSLLETDLRTKRQDLQEVQKENELLGVELIQVEKEQLKRERSLYRWEVELDQLQQSKEQILSLLEERELKLESILTREVTEKESSLKRKIDGLRAQIRDLGPVNPGATEEYERVLERCSFLQKQLKDLDEARDSLQNVINEMDKLCRVKLREVFGQVQVEFQKIFSQLFSGGQAELVLTDPESILTTGIDVLARPPGKKLQNLLLLSGGERALTAIALLFAIKRVKPTPFWLLDEIDAALDESNLQRFTDLMEEFSQTTQFLVVTHRPQTMESADTLYGVTMGEEAVSQIISVALT